MPMAPRNKTVDCPKRVDAIATLMTERLWAPDGSLAHRTDQLLEIVARGTPHTLFMVGEGPESAMQLQVVST